MLSSLNSPLSPLIGAAQSVTWLIFAKHNFPGIEGFLPWRGSFMLDVVVVAMLAVLPLLAWSIQLAKQKRFALHKAVQITLATVLLAAVTLFEVDMRLTGWVDRAKDSPYFQTDHKWSCPAGVSLLVHLCFAIPTLLLWIYVVAQALRKFPSPPSPGPHSAAHRRFGKLAGIGLFMTAMTGWAFYYLAFIAT